MTVIEARDADHERLGEICAAAYLHGDVVDAGNAYLPMLRDVAGRARDNLVLAAYLGRRPVGTVTLVGPGSEHAEVVHEGELEVRMLAVDPQAQGQGVATALIEAAVATARELGHDAVVLSSIEDPAAAARRYRRTGFERAPERDWVADWDAEALAAGTAPTVPVWRISLR